MIKSISFIVSKNFPFQWT